MAELVKLYSQNSPSLDSALHKLRRHPATRSRFPGLHADGRYAAMVWKRFFLIAIERMARQHPSQARLTVIEALKLFGVTVVSSRHGEQGSNPRASITELRDLVRELKAIKERRLRGATNPRTGLHPEILVERYLQAKKCFRPGVHRTAIQVLWRQWGGYTLPRQTTAFGVPQDLFRSLRAQQSSHEQSLILLATHQHTTTPVIRNALSRAGALRARPGYCPGCKVNKVEPSLGCCSACWISARIPSQVNADLP